MPRAWCLAFALASLFPGAVSAQQIPPPEDGDKLVDTKFLGDQVEMRDASNGAPIILPKGVPLWEDKNNAGSLPPVISFQSQPTGFDVVYTFDNNTNSNHKLGAIYLGILTLGHRVDYPDLRLISEPLYADYDEGYKVRQMHYPDTLYSPAWVLENADYAVGVSIQYPILEYEHTVRLCLYSPEGKYAEGEGGRGWKLEFLLSNVGNENEANELSFPGKIKPGEKFTYVVSVRVTKKPQEWVRTLVPYRNWFRGEYGGVGYQREVKCVNSRDYSSGELCTDDNPFGFGDSRPDLKGWGPTVNSLLERKNWDVLMCMTVSGSYRQNWWNNMPYQFATNWNANPEFATAYDPAVGFPRLPAAGQKIAFWWGRSVQVADEWDDATLVNFDPRNPNHRKKAFAEMDLAVKAGATTIGLDTFSPQLTPVWRQLEWLDELRARYPGVRYCAEPVCSDLIHREIATFYRGNKDRWEVSSPDEIDGFYNPHYMADFLLPGHETWGAFRWSTYADFGIYFTDQEKTDKLKQIASLGFRPCSRENFELLDPSIEAAESWKTTVPPDLQIEDDLFPTFALFDAAFNAGDSAADLNHDGELTLFDHTVWQNLHPLGK